MPDHQCKCKLNAFLRGMKCFIEFFSHKLQWMNLKLMNWLVGWIFMTLRSSGVRILWLDWHSLYLKIIFIGWLISAPQKCKKKMFMPLFNFWVDFTNLKLIYSNRMNQFSEIVAPGPIQNWFGTYFGHFKTNFQFPNSQRMLTHTLNERVHRELNTSLMKKEGKTQYRLLQTSVLSFRVHKKSLN